MNLKELEDKMEEVYQVGFRNGQIDMKNRALKTINRDWSIVGMKNPVDVAMALLKKVNKLKINSDFTTPKNKPVDNLSTQPE